ncbi:hypothetical protein ACNSOL_11745 (plasmid) [Aliarcobacter lanthieri]|uniref:hypothetical protein n=1 Tax=Aliarcobacter lanthieri TaxID=1355374 RepID=UPI003AAEC091
MMILSSKERLLIENMDDIVYKAEASLNYQIRKILDLCKKVKFELDKPRKTNYMNSTDFEYNVDFLINSFSVLIEYYHSWVIQQRIGLFNPDIKIDYKASNYDFVDDVLKGYNVGKTDRPELYDFDLYEKCKSRYLSDMSFFFKGKNHEIFVLNNYIKHNNMMRGYAPRVRLENIEFSFAYIYIDKNSSKLLNHSLLKYLLNNNIDDIKDIYNLAYDEYYKNYVKESNKEFYPTNAFLDIIIVNGLEYVKYSNCIGLSIESILESIKLASIDILNVMLDELAYRDITGDTDMDNLSTLKNDFKNMRHKTICNLLGEAVKS